MPVTGSKTLADFLRKHNLGVKHEDKNIEDQLNVALAERILRPDVGTNAKQQRMANFSVAQDQLGALLKSAGGVKLPKVNEQQILSKLGEGFDLSSFGRVEADQLQGNTRESRANAQRLTANLIGGESASFVRPEEPAEEIPLLAPSHAQKIAELKGLSPIEVTQTGKESRITKRAKTVKAADDKFTRKKKFRDELLPLIQESGDIINASDRTPEEKAMAEQNIKDARELLSGIGLESEASNAEAIARGTMASDEVDALNRTPEVGTPGTMTGEEGSAAALRGAKSSLGRKGVTSTKGLADMLDRGEIDESQFSASRKALLSGAKGVNPFGFSTGKQVGGIGRVQSDPSNPNDSSFTGVDPETGIQYNRQDDSGFIQGNPTRRSIRDGTDIQMGEGDRRGFGGGGVRLNAQGYYVPQSDNQNNQQGSQFGSRVDERAKERRFNRGDEFGNPINDQGASQTTGTSQMTVQGQVTPTITQTGGQTSPTGGTTGQEQPQVPNYSDIGNQQQYQISSLFSVLCQ